MPIVANGNADIGANSGSPSIACRLASIEFIEKILSKGRLVVDLAGEIQSEYHRHLNPKGQPGVGDRFYQTVINSAPSRVERIALEKDGQGNYVDFPTDPSLNGFDPSDRKFAALARKEKIPVANATDSGLADF